MFKKDSLEVTTDKVDTVIGKDTIFKGNINSKGLIRIDGKAEGQLINKGDAVIGESGKVLADIKARNITIAGYFEGTLEAEGKLELKKTATVAGTFKANGLIVEEGAIMSGDLEMQLKEQEGKAAAKKEWDYKSPGSDKEEKGKQGQVLLNKS